MSSAQRTTVVLAVLALVAMAAAWHRQERAVPAPEVTFPTIAGEAVTVGSMRGKVPLVNFRATSCVACVGEMPRFAELHRRRHPEGPETIAVAMSDDSPDHVVRFAERAHSRFALPSTRSATRHGASAKSA